MTSWTSPYLAAVADDLQRATALADEQTRAVTARVATVLEPALRLALLQALSDAAAEITAELGDTAVLVRMEGREPVLDIRPHHDVLGEQSPPPGGMPGEPVDAPEDDDTARVTVRIPASLKAQAEARAGSADQSLNTWIVHAVRRALAPAAPHHAPGPFTSRSRRVTGWA